MIKAFDDAQIVKSLTWIEGCRNKHRNAAVLAVAHAIQMYSQDDFETAQMYMAGAIDLTHGGAALSTLVRQVREIRGVLPNKDNGKP